MNNIYNAVSDCMEDLEYTDHFETFIDQVRDSVYDVLFRERRNGNNEFTIRVEYCSGVDLTRNAGILEDEAWHQWVTLDVISRHRVSEVTAELICENLATHIDEDHFDSDSEEEDSDDETETLPSEPRTPMPRSSRPLVPRLRLPQRNLP